MSTRRVTGPRVFLIGIAAELAGKGAPRLKGEGRGALIAKLRVQVPRELSDEQREALERFAALEGGDPREALFR